MRLARLLLAAAAAASLLASPVISPAISQDRYNSEDYRAVGRALTCQCGGCNARVAECAMDRCPSSEPIREEIAERLQAGESAEEVVQTFAERYGLVILAAPPTTGFHLAAWILPGVFFLGGAVVAVSVMRRRRKSAPASPAPGVPTAEAQAEVIARIERDVEHIR